MVVPDTILIATTNAGKFRELSGAFAEVPVKIRGLAAFPQIPKPEEDGATFEENAALKAFYYSKHSHLWTLADDSGLEVDALGGSPGVHSARYAGDDATDAQNNAKLIRMLEGVARERRNARFRCALAVADGNQLVLQTSGSVDGVILDAPRGSNGFGYDPYFFLPELALTMAELPPARKNEMSHRGQALRRLKAELERLSTPSTS